MRKPTLRLYQGRDRKWRWRLVAANGEKVAQSESYSSKAKAAKTMRRLGEWFGVTVECS